jgi:hypothetical protein
LRFMVIGSWPPTSDAWASLRNVGNFTRRALGKNREISGIEA